MTSLRTALLKWQGSSMRKVLANLALNLYLFLEKGDREMMAMLFAQRVILGKTEFEQVPNKLKKPVADILINECGLPELVTEEYGGTKKVEA